MQNIVFRKAGAKVLLFFDMTKFFRKKMQKTCVIGKKSVILQRFIAHIGSIHEIYDTKSDCICAERTQG